MPCKMEEDYETAARYAEEAEKLTQWLCWIIRQNKVSPAEFPAELAAWWTEHEWSDKAREEQEKKAAYRLATKKAALSKLTKAERESLGIFD